MKAPMHVSNFFSSIGPVGQRESVQNAYDAAKEGHVGSCVGGLLAARGKAALDGTVTTVALPVHAAYVAIGVPINCTLAVASTPFMPFSKGARKFGKNRAKGAGTMLGTFALQFPKIAADAVAIVSPEATSLIRTDYIQRAQVAMQEPKKLEEKANNKLRELEKLSDKEQFQVEWDSKRCRWKMK